MNDHFPVNPESDNTTANVPAGPSGDAQSIQSAIDKLVEEETAALPQLKSRADEEKTEQIADAYNDHTGHNGHTALTDYTGHRNRTGRKKRSEHSPTEPKSRVSAWFFTFMCMNIPLIGWIYLLHLAFGKGRTDRREFARAYLFYKLLFLIISLAILAAVAMIAMDMLDQLLAYMQML